MQSEFCIKNMNLFEDNDRSEQPTVNIVGKRYVPVPLSYREALQSIGFKQGKNAHEWIKNYRGYTIVSRERTNRLKIDILIRKDRETLLTETAYTEKQILNTVKEFEQKIDKFKKDPYDRSEESIYEQMNSFDDEEALTRTDKLPRRFSKYYEVDQISSMGDFSVGDNIDGLIVKALVTPKEGFEDLPDAILTTTNKIVEPIYDSNVQAYRYHNVELPLEEAIVDGQMIEIAYHSDWDITDLVGEKQTLKKYGIEVTLQGSVPDSYGTHRLCIKGTAKQLLTYAEETEDEQLMDALEEQILNL